MLSPLLDALLDPLHLVLDLPGKSGSEAVWQIVRLLGERGELSSPKEFFEAVMEREAKSSTVANGGVAFPHARTQLVEQLLLGIGRSREGVTLPGNENRVHLIFVIAVPQQMINDYLICVGSLARRLNNEATREALMEASTAAEFIKQLRGS